MRIVKIKNLQEIDDTYCGQTIIAGEYYQLQDEHEIELFAEDLKLKQHLWSSPAKILINNGEEDLNAVNGDKWLDNEFIQEVTSTGELVITWTQMKAFYDSVSATCVLNYIDLTTHYYIWVKFQDQKMYVPELIKETAECIQFEASYKSKCNIAEWPRVRTTTCKAGRKMHYRFITFKTATDSSGFQYDNTDEIDQDFGDVTYIMKDASGNTTTDFTICKETWISWMPVFDYELSGGQLFVPETLPGNLDSWEIHVIAVPDLPSSLGGSIKFISNPRIKWLRKDRMEILADNNPSELKYNATYKTNKVRVIVKHPIAQQAEFQIAIRLFK